MQSQGWGPLTWRGEGSLSQKCEGRTAPRQDQDARANRWMLRHEFKHKPKLGGGTSVPAVNLSFLSWGDKAQVQLPSKPFDFVHQLQLVVPYDSSEILLPVLTPTKPSTSLPLSTQYPSPKAVLLYPGSDSTPPCPDYPRLRPHYLAQPRVRLKFDHSTGSLPFLPSI